MSWSLRTNLDDKSQRVEVIKAPYSQVQLLWHQRPRVHHEPSVQPDGRDPSDPRVGHQHGSEEKHWVANLAKIQCECTYRQAKAARSASDGSAQRKAQAPARRRVDEENLDLRLRGTGDHLPTLVFG
ncbi:MAG: hypothetical protein ACLGIY_17485 [Betaproteobacteria bacterium]|uniref:hypothetical protein n=1 Tax=Acidovorax sp. 94 TaxID=2135633 RepID=UPI001314C8FA|nr:hypothetical protein [Acidovorax sp. 94]